MWDQLRTKLDLDPPTKFNDSVYLGCGQHDVEPHMPTVEAKRKMYAELFSNTKKTTAGYNVEGTPHSRCLLKGHSVQCVERYCELAKADVSSL